MTPEQSLGPASDLVFTRLDLPQLPRIAIEDLVAWMTNGGRDVIREHALHQKNMPGVQYPWRAVTVCENNHWEESFEHCFPELRAYVDLFPTTRWRKIALLAQLPGEDVFLHTDPDFGVGWRIYLNHGGPRLYFQKFKERRAERPSTWLSGGPSAIESLCQAERHYVEEAGTFPWALTSIRAAHGVEPHHSDVGARITMLLFPDRGFVDREAHVELLLRSARTYADSAIWWSESNQMA